MKNKSKLSLGLIALGISSCATFHWNGERPDLGIQFAVIHMHWFEVALSKNIEALDCFPCTPQLRLVYKST